MCEYAYHLRLSEAAVKLMVIQLALQGYISYDAKMAGVNGEKLMTILNAIKEGGTTT